MTITGSGFDLKADGTTSTTAADITVTLNGIDCAVDTVTSTTVECVTGYRGTLLATPSLIVEVADKGAAAPGSVLYTYIDLWSATTTWGGLDPPIEGDSVVIPAGQNILLDISPPQLYLVLIEGRLEFDTTQDLTFDASYIFLRGQGAHLQVGTLEEPFPMSAIITLHGRPPGSPELPVVIAPDLPIYGAKNIAVRGGTLDLHGLPKLPTWTKLGADAAVGDTSITLDQPVNWAVGDEIVVASSGYVPTEAEKVTVTGVSGDGYTLTFEPPLEYVHYGHIVTYDNTDIDMRAEVSHMQPPCHSVLFWGIRRFSPP